MKDSALYFKAWYMILEAKGKPWKGSALNYLWLAQRRLKRNNRPELARFLERLALERLG